MVAVDVASRLGILLLFACVAPNGQQQKELCEFVVVLDLFVFAADRRRELACVL